MSHATSNSGKSSAACLTLCPRQTYNSSVPDGAVFKPIAWFTEPGRGARPKYAVCKTEVPKYAQNRPKYAVCKTEVRGLQNRRSGLQNRSTAVCKTRAVRGLQNRSTCKTETVCKTEVRGLQNRSTRFAKPKYAVCKTEVRGLQNRSTRFAKPKYAVCKTEVRGLQNRSTRFAKPKYSAFQSDAPADVAQRQSSGFVNRRLWVRLPSSAPIALGVKDIWGRVVTTLTHPPCHYSASNLRCCRQFSQQSLSD